MSGLNQQFTKLSNPNRFREFESRSLRNDPQGLLNAVRAEHHCVRRRDEIDKLFFSCYIMRDVVL